MDNYRSNFWRLYTIGVSISVLIGVLVANYSESIWYGALAYFIASTVTSISLITYCVNDRQV